MNEPITVLVCALGGEGGGVLAQWLYETAVHAGHPAQSTSIPGVAQRTGATTYYVEIHPQPERERGGRRPLFSLSPVPGAIDLLASSELLETVRQVGLGYASAERTVVLSSSARALTVLEKIPLGDGRQDDERLLAAARQHSRAFEVLDMTALARASGTAISAVMLGAIAGSGRLPFERAAFEDTIRRSGKGVDASLRGFAAACDLVAGRLARREQPASHGAALPPATGIPVAAPDAAAAAPAAATPLPPVAATPPLPPAVQARFPAPLHGIVALGYARVLEYQDGPYAALYVDRLAAVLQAERAAASARAGTVQAAQGDGAGADGAHWPVTQETARWLALWMAFDDLVRVAALKLSAARIERVRREVGARDDEVLRLYDHFKPGVPEMAALLPAALARRLQAWDAARVGRGREPWALPLRLGAHTVLGTLALRLLAGCTGLRRRGSRYAQEQALIDQWLAGVQGALQQSAALGLEVAQCGRLIKGYGSTNERGKANLLHIVGLWAQGGSASADPAAAVRAARLAALADDAGQALDRTLLEHGAAPRPLREQPIRWHRRKTGAH